MVIMMTDVTIRGIRDEVYNEFSAEARKQNKSIGDFTTEAMRSYLERLHPTEKGIRYISGAQELRVSRQDLEDFNQPIIFRVVEHLIFEDDVDLDTFEKYIVRLEVCERVEFPKHFPKLYTYEKCEHCEQITRRE